jgi:hypothetical protein
VLVPGRRDGDVVMFPFGDLLFLAVAGNGFPLLPIGDVVACGVAFCLISDLEGLLSG